MNRRTGGLLTYVGECHTRSRGGSDLSDTDKEAVINLRSILDPAGAPTLVTIVTLDGIHPHLFEPTSPPMTFLPRRPSVTRIFGARLGWQIK